jgi:hypothetical protein
MESTMTGSRFVAIAVVALVACASAACFQYHVAPCTARPLTVAEAVADSPPAARCEQPQWDPATEWETKTAHSLLWGLARSPEYVFTTVCPAGSGIDQVRVHDNLGYSVITVATLGIWSPKRIAYTCTKREQPSDDAAENAAEASP